MVTEICVYCNYSKLGFLAQYVTFCVRKKKYENINIHGNVFCKKKHREDKPETNEIDYV